MRLDADLALEVFCVMAAIFSYVLMVKVRRSADDDSSVDIDILREIQSVSGLGDGAVCLVVFASLDCPSCRATIPSMKSDLAYLQRRGISAVLVLNTPASDADPDPEKIFEWAAPILINPSAKLLKAMNPARRSPGWSVLEQNRIYSSGVVNDLSWRDFLAGRRSDSTSALMFETEFEKFRNGV